MELRRQREQAYTTLPHPAYYQHAALGGLISDDWFDNLKDTLSDLGAKGLGLIDKVKKEFDDKGAAIVGATSCGYHGTMF